MFLFLFLSVSDAMTGHYNEERKSMLYHIIDSSCLPNIFASYAFTKCVKKKLSEKVGCKLPWDNQSAGDAGHAAHLDHILFKLSIARVRNPPNITAHAHAHAPLHHSH